MAEVFTKGMIAAERAAAKAAQDAIGAISPSATRTGTRSLGHINPSAHAPATGLRSVPDEMWDAAPTVSNIQAIRDYPHGGAGSINPSAYREVPTDSFSAGPSTIGASDAAYGSTSRVAGPTPRARNVRGYSNASGPVNPVATTGAPAAAGMAQGMSTMMGMGMGAAIGGTSSYMTGGNFGQGAVAGAIGGGLLGANAGAIGRGVRMANVASGKQFGSRGYSSNLSRLMKGMENPANRAYAFGAGGFLGGMMFGGNKSHKRGFNSKRGNSIGR